MTQRATNKQADAVRLVKAFREIPADYHNIAPKAVFQEFWNHASTEKRVFVIMLLSVVLQGGIAGSTIYLLKNAIDLFFESANLKTVSFLVGTLFLATVFKSLLEFIFNWKKTVAVARIHDKLLVKAFKDLLLNPFHFHVQERDRKKYRWVLKDSIKFIDALFGMFNAWGKQPFVLLSTIIALWFISPFLTLIGLLLVPLGMPCILLLKRKTKEFIAQRKQLLGGIEEIVTDSIRSIRIVKVFGLEERKVLQLEDAIDRQRDINMKNSFYLGLMAPLSELLGFLGLTVIIIVGSQSIVSGTFTTGTFFVFIMAFLNIYRPLKDISNGFVNYQLALDAGRRLIVLRQRAEKAEREQSRKPLTVFESLEVRDIWFSYNNKDTDKAKPVLRGLSLKITAGETVAVVGATGAGKSTLCDLMCRLYEPQEGTLLLNGIPISELSPKSVTNAFALCSQETIVFNDSIYNEILVGYPEASADDVQTAAEAACLSAYIDAPARNLETHIGDRGIHFSGGQRQLIAIARALLRKPKVLILDEAMSGLDVETSRRIWSNIRQLLPGTTIVAVSHNWDIIRHCQRVLVLSRGRIARSMAVEDIKDQERFFKDFHLDSSGTSRG